MQLSTREADLLAGMMVDVAREVTSHELRRSLGERLLRLLRADQFASYVWSPDGQRFDGRVAINMSPDNLDSYESYYQFHDPITHRLRRYRRATFVEEVAPRESLTRTEFFHDFLARDGLHHGLNYFAWHGPLNLGDLRVWRQEQRPDFAERDRLVLDMVGRAFTAALVRAHRPAEDDGIRVRLTPREDQVARAVAAGLTDQQIAQELGVSFATVRSHVQHIYDKLQVRNRAQLTGLLARRADG